MFIHKEFILIFIFVIVLCLFLLYKLILDFRKLNAKIKNLDEHSASSSDFFFFSTFEPIAYNSNSIKNIYVNKLKSFKSRIKFYESFFNLFPDPLIIVDKKSNIIELNVRGSDIVGENAKGKNIHALLKMPDLIMMINNSIEQNTSQTERLQILSTQDRTFDVWVSIDRSKFADFLFIRFYDATAEIKSKKIQSDFVANVSHELKTPISALVGYCETLLGIGKNDKIAREKFLKIMKLEVDRIASLVSDLLSLSRIEQIEFSSPKTRVDLIEIINETKSLFEKNIIKKEVIFNFPNSQMWIIGDYNELKQVFINIIENSIKYGKSQESIQVSLRKSNEKFIFQVQDFGQGIENRHIPLLTNRFYRVDNSRKRDFGSTGLGLSIVKHILSRHNTRLNIESTVGKGSKFSVEFSQKI